MVYFHSAPMMGQPGCWSCKTFTTPEAYVKLPPRHQAHVGKTAYQRHEFSAVRARREQTVEAFILQRSIASELLAHCLSLTKKPICMERRTSRDSEGLPTPDCCEVRHHLIVISYLSSPGRRLKKVEPVDICAAFNLITFLEMNHIVRASFLPKPTEEYSLPRSHCHGQLRNPYRVAGCPGASWRNNNGYATAASGFPLAFSLASGSSKMRDKEKCDGRDSSFQS